MVAIAADVLLIAVDAAVVDLVTIAVDSLLIVADAAAALPDAVVEPVATSARGRARNAARGGVGDGEVGEDGGVDGGADVVGLEDGPVDEHEEADGEEEPAEAFSTAAALVSPAAAAAALSAWNGGQKTLLPPRWLVNWGEGRREEMGGASLCVFWSCDPAGEFKTKLMVLVPTILITTRHTAAQKC